MANTSLSRTVSTQGNRQIGTFSAWIKNNKVDGTNNNEIWSAYYDGQNFDKLYFNPESKLTFYVYEGGATAVYLKTKAVYRDVSAWYHIVLKIDTTQATASDRVILYVNGEEITATGLEQNTYPTLNKNLDFNLPAFVNRIGDLNGTASSYFNGSMAHVHFIDGTAYDASAFGETDATTGIWKPKTAPSVTYGTNGFFLKFENSGSMGTDSSGNGNNFTVNGTPTQTVDTPSNVFCTLNPLDRSLAGTAPTFAYGNTQWTSSGNATANNGTRMTLGVSQGKYYFEGKFIEASYINLGYQLDSVAERWDASGFVGTRSGFYGIYSNASDQVTAMVAGVDQSTVLATLSNNDILGFAYDFDNGKYYVSVNGTWLNSGDPTSGATGTGSFGNLSSGTYVPIIGNVNYNIASNVALNFGNGYFGTTAVASGNADDNGLGIFEYAPPTGYLALCTKNINAQEYS